MSTNISNLAADHYVLQVEACTFCGSDLDALSSGMSDWLPLGHEVSARILKSPATARSDLHEGDRVAVELSTMCGFCQDCRGGRPESCNCCPPLRLDAIGGFSEIITATANSLWKINDLSPKLTCLVQPLAAAIDAFGLGSITVGQKVAVLGVGPVALMLLYLARQHGVEELTCITTAGNSTRTALAKEIGASIEVVEHIEQPDVSAFHARFDCVFNTAPFSLLTACCSLCRYGGKIVNIGIGNVENATFSASLFHWKRLSLRSAFARPNLFFHHAIQLISENQTFFDKFITHEFALKDIQAAVSTLSASKRQTIKVVVLP